MIFYNTHVHILFFIIYILNNVTGETSHELNERTGKNVENNQSPITEYSRRKFRPIKEIAADGSQELIPFRGSAKYKKDFNKKSTNINIKKNVSKKVFPHNAEYKVIPKKQTQMKKGLKKYEVVGKKSEIASNKAALINFKPIKPLQMLHASRKNKTKKIQRQLIDAEMPTEDIKSISEETQKPSKASKTSDLEHSEGSSENCWMNVNAKEHFEIMDSLDDRYAEVRDKYQKAVDNDNFDKEMLAKIPLIHSEQANNEIEKPVPLNGQISAENKIYCVTPSYELYNNNRYFCLLIKMMLKSRGAAERAVHNVGGNPYFIPAGFNLGGYCMMRLPNSILLFHRMKLRNNTHFDVKYLHNNLADMVLNARLSLNDLHILGAYERSLTVGNSLNIIYAPTFGEVEFLLKNVQYKMEGRYRLIRDKLSIELIVSDILVNDVLMMYMNNGKTNNPTSLEKESIAGFLEQLKNNLDKWLKAYFNDYLMYFGLAGSKATVEFHEYEQKKTNALNDYTDYALQMIKNRLQQLNAFDVEIPEMTVHYEHGMMLNLKRGVLRGLNTIHRRSFATGKKEKQTRMVDAVVGFGSLKAMYEYEVILPNGVPPMTGMLVLSADELTAHMSLSLKKDPESLIMKFNFLEQIKPESLVIEGPANRILASWKYVLQRHVFTLVTNTIIHNIRMIRTLTKCADNNKEPSLKGHIDLIDEKSSETEESEENNYFPTSSNVFTPTERIITDSNESNESKTKISKEEDFDHNKSDNKTDKDKSFSMKQNIKKRDFILTKDNSLEVELPSRDGDGKVEKIHLKHEEKLILSKNKL